MKCLPIKYISRTALVNKDPRPHEIGDDNGDDYGVILVNGVDAFEVFVGECYGREASW